MIEVVGLSKSYGRVKVLNALSLSARSGKSTTLRVLAGLSSAVEGRVLVNGHDVMAAPGASQAGLSFLPQSPRFHARLTVAQILSFYAKLRGLNFGMPGGSEDMPGDDTPAEEDAVPAE